GLASTGAVAIPLTEGERSLVLDMSRVTANFFHILGARPVLGRLLRPEDGEAGAAPVTVISYDTWQREFGGDPGVLGRYLTQTQYQDAYAIVGVATPGLDFPVGVDYWIPIPARDAVNLVARLAPGVATEVARSEFLSIAQAIDGRRSNPRSPATATVRPLSEIVVGDARPVLVAITSAVALLLLIACVNVGNLLLMRATQRSRDVVLHRALGATSGRIARHFLVEATVLGVVGGALGLILAVWLLRVLPALAPDRLPRMDMIGQAGAPVAVTLVVTGLAVLLFGVGPAVAAARGDLGSALRAAEQAGSGTRGRRRLRRFLVAAQVALAVVLLVSGGLLVRSFQRLAQLELGYDAEAVAIVELGINREAREGPEETFAMLEGVLERMRAVPGVTAATPIMIRPFMGETGIFQTRPMLEGQRESDAEFNPQLPLEVGGHELFRTLGIPIIRGRGLRETDREGAPRVAVVSQAVAERLWPGEDPIGKRIHLVTSEASWWTVVGVTGDTRFRRLRESTPTVFLHWRQLQILPGVWTVALRTERDFASVEPTMRRVVRDFDPRVHVWRVGRLNDHLSRGPLAKPRMSALLVSGFGLAALLLAATGLYAVMALVVRERTHELGVRKALGASPARLQKAVLGDALVVTLAGTVAGLGGALFMSRLLVTLLFEISPADPAALLGVSATLLAVAMVAAYLPARRATRVDPMRALRSD
ncbi:MAG TPA: ADOP family duplicated permease, partial [Longimicrobiales bacterium]|nr:ADOP family duplicated permease [Longimicrobiales bacterium]